jgi:tubulin polyglutamylase TTLL5
VYRGGTRALHFRVKSQRPEVTNIVTDVFAQFLTQWEALPSGLGLGLSWNLLWTWSKPRINKSHLLIWQRVNHFEHSRELTRKDLLKKNIQRYVDLSGGKSSDFEIMPPTFVLPHEYTQFVSSFTAFEQQKRDGVAMLSSNGEFSNDNGSSPGVIYNYWILKPVGLSRGRGISLVRDISDLTYSQSSVIQKYIERPLCLAAYKFDLRIYVVVTSFKPLEAFVYRDGFARVSTQQYSLNPNDVNNKFIHLTNSSIQKQNQQDLKSDNPLNDKEGGNKDIGGSKISLLGENGLWKLLERFQGIDSDLLWKNICLLIVKSLVIVDDKMTNQPCCFELFGYDVLIDNNLRPWLIEVNASPSLARENALDSRVKNNMLKDMIDLLEVTPFDRAALFRIIKRRLASIGKNRYYVSGRNDPDLEQDLQDILGANYVHRAYGDLPSNLGNYERLCPETSYHQVVLKLKKKIIKSD